MDEPHDHHADRWPDTDGLEPLEMPLSTPRFVHGDPDPDRFRVRYFQRPADGAVVCHVRFGPKCQGPPRHAHGGSIAAVLDEVMGFACWIAGHAVVAGRLSIGYRKPVPLERILVAEGLVHEVRGRKVTTRGRVIDPHDGTLLCDGEGLFVNIAMERFRAMAGQD